jgi:hypothetical protein
VLNHHLDRVMVLRRGGGWRSGGRSLERKGKGRRDGHGGIYSHEGERVGGGPGRVHVGEGKERVV